VSSDDRGQRVRIALGGLVALPGDLFDGGPEQLGDTRQLVERVGGPRVWVDLGRAEGSAVLVKLQEGLDRLSRRLGVCVLGRHGRTLYALGFVTSPLRGVFLAASVPGPLLISSATSLAVSLAA
jgi:hypothetical protein